MVRSHLAARAVLVFAVACGPAGPTTGTATTGTPTATTAAPSPTPVAPSFEAEADPRVADLVDVPSQPRGLALLGGRLWVTSARADRLTAIDTSTVEVVAEVEASPTPVSVVTLGDDLWVSLVDDGQVGEGQAIVRVDPATGSLHDPINVPVFHTIAAGADVLWVLDGASGLQRVDPTTGDVSTIDVGPGTQAITASGEVVVGVQEDGTIWRVDGAVGEVTDTADLGTTIGGRTRLAVVDDELWIGTAGAVLVRDATTLDAVATIPVDAVEFVNDVEPDGGTVWVAATVRVPSSPVPVAVVLGFDRAGHQLRDRITFGREAGELVVDGATLWAADQGSDTVARILLR